MSTAEHTRRYYAKHKDRIEFRARRRAVGKKYRETNRDVLRAKKSAAWRAANPERHAAHSWRKQGILKRAGQALTWSDFTGLLAMQGGACLLCGRKPGDGEERLVPDHHHATGTCRGLICRNPCNVAVGLLEARGIDVVAWAHRASVLLMVPAVLAEVA